MLIRLSFMKIDRYELCHKEGVKGPLHLSEVHIPLELNYHLQNWQFQRRMSGWLRKREWHEMVLLIRLSPCYFCPQIPRTEWLHYTLLPITRSIAQTRVQCDPSGRWLLFVDFNLVVTMSALLCSGGCKSAWHVNPISEISSKRFSEMIYIDGI